MTSSYIVSGINFVYGSVQNKYLLRNASPKHDLPKNRSCELCLHLLSIFTINVKCKCGIISILPVSLRIVDIDCDCDWEYVCVCVCVCEWVLNCDVFDTSE